MSSDNKSLVQKVKQVAVTGSAEHILNILKAGLATTPFCGGIASLMSDYIPNAKFERLEKFANQIAEDLVELQSKVDETKIHTDEFAYIFEECFRGVAENYQKEKIEAFRGILINTAVGSNVSEDEKEFFLNLVNTLSVLHIRILKFMDSPIEYLSTYNIPQESIHGGFSQFFPVAIPGVSVEVIQSAFGDLHQYGFTNTDKSIFNTMTSGQGLNLIGNRVTEFGHKFMNFCLTPKYK